MLLKCLSLFLSNYNNKEPLTTLSKSFLSRFIDRQILPPIVVSSRGFARGLSNNIESMETGYVTVSYVTVPNEEVARGLARRLVENRLAACVNIVKAVESIYEWKGKVEKDNESLLIIKSHSDKTNSLTDFVIHNHPYDCPEVVTLKVEGGSKKYLDWVIETVNKTRLEESNIDTP